MKVLTAHVPLPLAAKIDDYSARLDRSRGWIVKQALEDWVAKQEAQNSGGGGFAEPAQKFDFGASERATQAHDALKQLRKTTTLGDILWQELRDTGRK